MITKSHALKDSRHRYARLALAACIYYAGTEQVLSADIPTAAPETSLPSINSVPEIVNPIPADNPIGAILLSKQHPLLLHADFSRVSELVSQIYLNTQFQPIWFTANRSEKNLNDLLSILNNASNDALNPVNYDVDRLKQVINGPNPDNSALAAGYDVALTVCLVRYLHDLRQGQVDPRDVEYPVHIAPKPALDLAGLLKQHLASQTLTEVVGQFEPKTKQYQQLKQILTRLQQLGNQTGSQEFKPGKMLRPGDKHPHIVYLRQRLRDMGLLDNNAADSKSYDNDLVAAVKKVQQQQGLTADGVIGSATAALFNQSSSEKVAQIGLAMERARWIPDTTDGPMIVVNIPAFELWAFNSIDDPNPLNMKVVVGKSPSNQTPVLWEEMKYLEFMPYWNIPKTIYEKEILPKAANNEGYLASQDIELVRHQNSEEKGGGSYLRARQRPGKKNPLGRVKFVFPNTADVYLHDTPGHAAFNRPRRDLSHGCVRVSAPEQLAQFVLGDQAGWDKESIKQAMSTPKTRHVTLKRAVPVLFYYGTTFVDHQNQLRFYPDVYGQDEQLKKALDKIHAPKTANSSPNNQLVMNKSTEVAPNP